MLTQLKTHLLLVLLLCLMIIGAGFLSLQQSAAHANPPSHSSPSSQMSNWSMAGYNAQHTGYNPHEHTLSRANVKKLTLDWSYTVESSAAIAPVAVGNIVYTVALEHGLYALNARTGALLWFFPATYFDTPFTPVVANGTVYFVARQDHTLSELYALNATTGKVKWGYSENNFYLTAPVVDHGMVYISKSDGSLYAFDATTGKVKWRSASKAGGFTQPTIADGVAYVATINTLSALDLETGHLLWNYNSICFSSPSYVSTVAYGFVYIGTCDQRLLAIQAKTGKLAWSYAYKNANFTQPSVANGIIYVGSNSNFASGDFMAALDARTGHVRWYNFEGNTLLLPQAIANNVVYYSSSEGNIFGLDTKTGKLLWQYTCRRMPSSPVIANGLLYVNTPYALLAFHVVNSQP